MSRHFPLLVLLTVAVPFITLHTVLMPRWQAPAIVQEVVAPAVEEVIVDEPEIPDFASIGSVRERKSQFFDFITQYVDQRNTELLAMRKRIVRKEYTENELHTWAKRYRVKWTTPAEVRIKLLGKVDAVPPSLVLAQAALESAWGTSRFASVGNNFFGLWCHSPGCGMVPNRRHEGLSHEVQIFESPFDSVAAYMRNLNSHPAYKGFRQKRAELRMQREVLNGCYLAHGLTQYSQMGEAYVENLKLLIRANRLERDPKGYCTPVNLAEKPQETAIATEGEAQTLAADQIQENATPLETDKPAPQG